MDFFSSHSIAKFQVLNSILIKSLYSNCFIRIKSKRCVISKRKFSILTRSKNLKNIFEVPLFRIDLLPEVSNIPKWHVLKWSIFVRKKWLISKWPIFLIYLKWLISKWPVFRSGPYFKSDLFSNSPFCDSTFLHFSLEIIDFENINFSRWPFY